MYLATLFTCTLTAGPVLDRGAIVTSKSNVGAAARHSPIPHFAAPIGTDVPEPATYLVVGTVLIGFSIGVHALRRRRMDKVAAITTAAEKDESLREGGLSGVASQS